MKKFLILTILVLSGIFTVSAQQTANEGYVGYSFLRQDVKFNQFSTSFNENTDSNGFVASYTRYLTDGKVKGDSPVGVTVEVGANFDSTKVNLVTVAAGVTVKARKLKYVQPSVKALVGVSRQEVTRANILDTKSVTSVFILGGGLDFSVKKSSRYKLHVGADYLNNDFSGKMQHGLRLTTGLVF